MGYVNEINTDFFTTSEFFYLMSWSALVPTQEDIWKLGVYEKNNAYCRDFDTSIGTVQARMFINETGDGQYRVSVRGLVARTKLDDWINAATEAMGFKIIGSVHEYLNTAVEFYQALTELAGYDPVLDMMEFYIDALGRSVYDKNVLDFIFNYFQETYGPMENPYTITQKVLPDGNSIITEWEASDLPYINGAYNEKMYNILNEMLDKDEFHRAMFGCPIVRIFYRTPYAPQDFTFDIFGYRIDNNQITGTTEEGDNQHYSALCTYEYHITYSSYDDGPLTVIVGPEERTISRTEVFYNYNKWTYLNAVSGTIRDSLGFSVTTKPYEITGVLTAPNWGTGEDVPVTVIDDGDPEEKTQPDYQTGDVPPNVKLPVPPVKGTKPEPYPDEDSPETVPDVDGIETEEGFYHVWDLSHPDSVSVATLGSWLWNNEDSTIFDKLEKQFNNDPLQAVISLHQIYADPHATESGVVKFGSVSTDHVSKKVKDRYQKIECGTRTIRPFFNDVRDYQTDISIYLPFIGIRQLDINDVLNSILYVDYYVDFFTGDCVADIAILRDGHNKKTLYMFNGNCASQLPVTGQDRSRLYSSLANVGVGAVTTALTGNPMGLINTGLNMATSHQLSIEKTGSLTGNHGAMMFKKPYLIISRPQPFDAVDRGIYEGMPTNVTATIGKLTGFVRVKSMHVESIPYATDEEKQMILSAMQQGVIL